MQDEPYQTRLPTVTCQVWQGLTRFSIDEKINITEGNVDKKHRRPFDHRQNENQFHIRLHMG
jgi:hypothetical protein